MSVFALRRVLFSSVLICAALFAIAQPTPANAELGVLSPVLENGEPLSKNDAHGRPVPVVTRVRSGALYAALQREAGEGFTATMLALDEAAQHAAGATALRPTWLYLSAEDGGFARIGFWLDEDGTQRFVDEPFVDLVVDDDSVRTGDFEEIFAHELGHVFLRRLLPNLPDGYSRTPHASFAITDYPTAFDEGFGIHLQGLARRLTRNDALRELDLGLAAKPFLGFWLSNQDRALRIAGMRSNAFAHAQITMPGEGDALLRRDHSTLFDSARLKNGQQMLSSEGVVATLFYRWLVAGAADHDAVVQRYSRLFAALARVHTRTLASATPVFLELARAYVELYPDERERVFGLIVDTTYGATVDLGFARRSEHLAAIGRLGDQKRFVGDLRDARAALSDVRQRVSRSPDDLRAALGHDIWLLTTATPPLAINLNTAELEQFAALPGIDARAAMRALNNRVDAGAYRDLADFVARNDLGKAQAQRFAAMELAMRKAGAYSRR